MRLTEEMRLLEQRMVEAEDDENVVAVAAMALGCFLLLASCWVLAWVLS